MWLAIKTRSDIAAVTSIVASTQTLNPEEALKITEGVWRYLAMTWDVVNVIKPTNGDLELEITTDASLAPGGDRSRTSVVVSLNGVVLCWQSTRQSIVAISSCESEINASVTGLKLGLAIRELLEEALPGKIPTKLFGDNTAVIKSILTQITSWRTRHYAMRASWIRDMLSKENVQPQHRNGTELVSDSLTKILDKQKLQEARLRLGLRAY